MNTTVHLRGDVGRTGLSVSRILVIFGIFIAVLSLAWLIGSALVASSRPVSVQKIPAAVQLAPDELGRCEHFEWDNESGLMSPKGATQCAYIRPNPVRQLDGIKHHFESR